MRYTVRLASETDFGGFRAAARRLAAARIAPAEVSWALPGEPADLFGAPLPEPQSDDSAVTVSKSFLAAAEKVACHRDPDRYGRLYRLLVRLQETPALLANAADEDVHWLHTREKAIRRDIHKTHAFVRFRKVGMRDEREIYGAWFEPTHLTLPLSAPFFQRRFPGMDWAIVTPEQSARWDGRELVFGPGGSRDDVPAEDAVEDQWRTYFSSIFNPARLKVSAMTAEMPKKYWRNLPEAELIPDLIASAQDLERRMIDHGPTAPHPLTEKRLRKSDAPPETPDDLAGIEKALEGCERCPLFRDATQAVPGRGAQNAWLMIVGEQPGDQEDLSGEPFVGPAGQLLSSALEAAGIDRQAAFVTNAVKHFKFQRRGKRRIHQKPTAGEIDTCRWWLDHERALVRPRVILALGASAARGVLGKAVKISEVRGHPLDLEDGVRAMVTVHPSYLLRIPADARADAEAAFLEDLRQVAGWAV